MGSDVSVSVMGFLELRDGERVLTPSAPKLRSLLALLALRSNRIVTTGTLMEELWGNNPPVSALATLQTYIYQLRRVLTEVSPDEQLLQTRPLGYLIMLGPEELDWNRFQERVQQGRDALARGDAETAATVLGDALALSTAPPLADVEAGPALSAHVNQLMERKLQALELRIEADLQLGRYRELVAELKTLITEHPFHEDFYAKLMVSLERSGRRSEALEVYQQLRGTLIDELGIEPSAKVGQLQARLLAAHEEPGRGTESEPGAAPAPRFARPAQLPADLADFAGRTEAVAALHELALRTEQQPAAKLIAVTGMIGIGKSTLALHVAHRIRDRFTDGQFYAGLRGSSSQPADPYAVLGRFLRATGLTDADLPRDLDERAEMFRSWTADRTVLVVLDDAASAAQLRPLLPGGRRCTVLVTSCGQLPGLDGAKVLELEPLEVEACVDLLAAMIGRERVEREEDMAHSIATLCGRLPLAVRVIGAKLATAPCYPLRKIVRRLSAERRLLDELRTGECDLDARFAREHALLSADARTLLSCLTREIGDPHVSPGVAAALADLDPFTAELLLEELLGARFLRAVDLDGHGAVGYAVPRIVRSFMLQHTSQHAASQHPANPIAAPRIAEQRRTEPVAG